MREPKSITLSQPRKIRREYPRWQSIINDYSFDLDREGKAFSERDQRILDYLEKSIQEGDYLQNTKEYYLEKAHENPEETLHYWQEFTREFSFDPDAHEHLQTSLSVTEIDSVVQSDSPENSRELIHQAHSLLETIRDILPEEAFKKFEASLSDKPEEMTASCQNIIISHQETLSHPTVRSFLVLFWTLVPFVTFTDQRSLKRTA